MASFLRSAENVLGVSGPLFLARAHTRFEASDVGFGGAQVLRGFRVRV